MPVSLVVLLQNMWTEARAGSIQKLRIIRQSVPVWRQRRFPHCRSLGRSGRQLQFANLGVGKIAFNLAGGCESDAEPSNNGCAPYRKF